MLVALLGPLEVSDAGRAVPVSGQRLRRLLLRLAADAGRTVSGSELAFAVWGDEPPADQANSLQTLVSRLRRALGDGSLIEQAGSGYRLQGVGTDLIRFQEQLTRAAAARGAGDLAAALEHYRQALELWRGPALADADDADWAVPLIARWQDQRLAARQDRIECELQLGRPEAVVGELTDLAREHPRLESVTEQLMRALAAAGRAADGLAAYERLRARLAEDLGVDPSPPLRQAHQRLLALTDASTAPRPPRRTNLRTALTSFLGRDDEVKRISTLLDGGRLATVVGPGGAGKTRVAGVAAGQWLDRMADGVWLIELAPVTDPSNIPLAILTGLGIVADQVIERPVDTARKPTIERLIDTLADAEALLVLDNCEHLIAAVAAVVDQLLGRCPAVRILATSREPLGIDGEGLCMLAPLTLPDSEADPAEALSYPSVQLFADRARAVTAGFDVTAATVGHVVQIVRRLDGLPLAIELAAARLRALPVEEIAGRISDRFRLLTGGSRIAMPRHRTLRAVVEWSWDLLTESERLLAERLAIFPSGATVASAQAICADDALPASDILPLLIALVDKSLLKASPDSPVRYQMLETIREYGIERLAERSELATLRLRHAQLFAELARTHVSGLRGQDQLTHLRVLEVERDNLLSALAFLCDAGRPEEAAELAYPLTWYWTMLGRHAEAVRWLRLVLDTAGPAASPALIMVAAMLELNRLAADFGSLSADADDARTDRLVKLYRAMGELDPADDPLLPLVRAILTFFGGIDDGTEAALAPAVESADPWVAASALMFRANLWENLGDLERMRADATRSRQLFAELGDRWGTASAGVALAQLMILDGDLDAAIAEYEQAAGYLAAFGARTDAGMLHLRLADLYVRQGDLAAAHRQIGLIRDGDLQLGGRAQRLITDATLAAIAVIEDDRDSALELDDRLTAALAGLRLPPPQHGHMQAIVLATKVNLALYLGRSDHLADTVTRAYQFGIGTDDMPVLAQVALAVANWAESVGEPAAAAEILGAANQLRGSADPTDALGRRLAERLQRRLGAEAFGQAVRQGEQLDRSAALARVDPATVRR